MHNPATQGEAPGSTIINAVRRALAWLMAGLLLLPLDSVLAQRLPVREWSGRWEIIDLPAVADMTHAAGGMLIVDNVFATPLLQKPLQLGAEISGHAGPEADLEILQLALDCLAAGRAAELQVDLADARIVSRLLEGQALSEEQRHAIHAALAIKDASALTRLSAGWAPAVREGLLALVDLYGDISVLDRAATRLPDHPEITQALAQLRWLAEQIPGVAVSFDLGDSRGYAYYSGMRFAIYAKGASDALARGGRYDGVGAVFGHRIDRDRPAVGFSLDLKELVAAVQPLALRAAIRAPWGQSASLRSAIAALRSRGETVVCVLPGHESEVDEFHCDRELIEAAGQWLVQAL